ncbi:flagellar filament capping protein FliD [Paenibacillus hubeiensis]|uniref:flagellar filament capping protein FliD n=1 Tax=Paenibacillus hubeiensis TaxID=3077330 RepID=UPI0031BB7485
MVTRITGMASGMDVESLVQKLISAESAPLNKMNTQKQLMEWKREGYREMSTRLVTFSQTKITDLFSKASSLNAQTTKVSGDTSAVTAKAGSAASGVLDIEVTKLASAARAVSNAPTLDSGVSTPTDWGSLKLSDISGVTVSSGSKISIGGKDIELTENDTISTLVSKINNNTEAGVSAVYDSRTGKISLTSKATGAAGNNITLNDNGTGLFGASSFNLASANAFTGGDDAVIKANGLEMKQTSNTFMLNGVELTLNALTQAGKPAHIEAVKDTDKIVENVKAFVTAYNELLSAVNSKVGEERYRKYDPLTSDQKKDMSDSEIELWTSKAKSGMLKNDSILESTLSQFRTAMMTPVKLSGSLMKDGQVVTKNGSPITEVDMSYLGISTGTWQSKGQLIFDEDKFKAALDDNPNIVNDFFGSNFASSFTSTPYTDTESMKGDGIFARMRKISTNALSELASTAGTSKVSSDLTSSFNVDSTMGETLRRLEKQISEFQAKLNTKETNYYKKFSAMETAINRYNNTSSSLSSYL